MTNFKNPMAPLVGLRWLSFDFVAEIGRPANRTGPTGPVLRKKYTKSNDGLVSGKSNDRDGANGAPPATEAEADCVGSRFGSSVTDSMPGHDVGGEL